MRARDRTRGSGSRALDAWRGNDAAGLAPVALRVRGHTFLLSFGETAVGAQCPTPCRFTPKAGCADAACRRSQPRRHRGIEGARIAQRTPGAACGADGQPARRQYRRSRARRLTRGTLDAWAKPAAVVGSLASRGAAWRGSGRDRRQPSSRAGAHVRPPAGAERRRGGARRSAASRCGGFDRAAHESHRHAAVRACRPTDLYVPA